MATNFIADGPATRGFTTESATIGHGVNVQGTQCGVYGESLGKAGARVPPFPASPAGLGVCGVGDSTGVFGEGSNTAGVYGQSANGIGVIGNSLSPGQDGVVGLSFGKNPGFLGQGIGVVGATESAKGIGVCGMAVKTLAEEHTKFPGNPFIPAQLQGGEGTGVLGASGEGTGVLGASGNTLLANFDTRHMIGNGVLGVSETGAGVFGESGSGTGVYGQSTQGRGGVFESGELVAQVRLVPTRQKTESPQLMPQLPKNGKVGDLLLIRHTFRNVDVDVDFCSLWLCIPRDPNADDSDRWQQVSLGQVVIGTR